MCSPFSLTHDPNSVEGSWWKMGWEFLFFPEPRNPSLMAAQGLQCLQHVPKASLPFAATWFSHFWVKYLVSAAFLFIPVRSRTMPHSLIFMIPCPTSQSLGHPLKSFRIHPSTLLVFKTLRLARECFPRDLTLQSNLKGATFSLHWESLICLVCIDCAIRGVFSLQSTCIF